MQYSIDMCFYEAALKKREDITLCEKIGESRKGEMRANCIETIVKNTLDKTLCDLLVKEENKELCQSAISQQVNENVELIFGIPFEVDFQKLFIIAAEVKTSDFILKNAALELNIPTDFNIIGNKIIELGDISKHQTKEVNWEVVGKKPGMYEIVLTLSSNNAPNVTESKLVSVTRIEIVGISVSKKSYSPSDIVIIDSEVTNFNFNVTYTNLDLNIIITDPQDNNTHFPTDFSLIYAGETQKVKTSWTKNNKVRGVYKVNAYLYDSDRQLLNTKSTTFTVK